MSVHPNAWPRRRTIATAAMLVGAAVGGCTSDTENLTVCPRVAVLTEAGTLTRFEPGPGRDILDITYQVDVGDLPAQCTFVDTKKQGRRVTVELAPVFVAERGPADSDGKASFTWFVSVVRDGEILSKQPFEEVAEFPANRSRTIIQENDPPVVVDIPLPYKGAEYEYEVLVGFQLTQDELDYNRRWRGLGR